VKLQLAFDFLQVAEIIRLGGQVADLIDQVEIGTPVIIRDGVEAVRRLKAAFPGMPLVADLKIMDGGEYEASLAFEAGADWVTVLALADQVTIAQALKAARSYDGRIMVDMIGVTDIAGRAAAVEALGADCVCVHTAIDVQMTGGDPFDILRQVSEAVEIPVACAGGVNSEPAAQAIAHGASVVIVGGAIIKSSDANKAAGEIKDAMMTGVAKSTKLYKRVDDTTIREALEMVSTANISDAMHRFGDLPGLRPVVPGLKMAGPVVTVRTYPGDWAKPVEAIDVAGPGEVIIIDALGQGPAMWGELATHSAIQRGIAGVVSEGAVRDTPEIRELRFPVWTRLIMPTAGEPKGFGEINVPIKVGGILIHPGDWAVGDDDGVVILPKARAAEFANRAMDVLEKENRLRGEINRGSTLSQVAYLEKWEKTK